MNLTKGMKEQIRNAVVRETFTARDKALEEQEMALGDLIYIDRYGKYISPMSSMPAGFLPESRTIAVRFEAKYSYTQISMSTARRVSSCSAALLYDPSHAFADQYNKLDSARDQRNKDKKELKAQLDGLLSGCSTDKKLLTIWPEAAQYLPKTGTTQHLPAVPIDSIRNNIKTMSEVKK
jgi:hypothetical protein